MDESLTLTNSDTFRGLFARALRPAGWKAEPNVIGQQHAITAGRIVLVRMGG